MSSAASSEKVPANTEASEQLLGARFEQVVAPLDRRAEGALALVRVSGAARQEGKGRVEAFEEARGSEESS